MKFSMNGFRRQLSNDVENLSQIIKAIVTDDYYEYEDLIDAINDVITHSNVINCVYDENDPDFKDMSDLEIEHLDKQELVQ